MKINFFYLIFHIAIAIVFGIGSFYLLALFITNSEVLIIAISVFIGLLPLGAYLARYLGLMKAVITTILIGVILVFGIIYYWSTGG